MFKHLLLFPLILLVSISVNAKTDAGIPLPELHIAVIEGNLAKVKQLVANGADINQLDPNMGNAPVHIAAQGDHPEILKYLLDQGAFINLQTPRSGFTPLMKAAWYSKAANIKLLFEYDELNIELTMSRGAKAENMIGGWDNNIQPHEQKLYDQLRQLFVEKRAAQQKLLASQKILNVLDDASLNEAAKHKQIKQLLAQGQNVNQRRPVYSNGNDWHTPLLVASRVGYASIVKLLLEHGADQTIPGYPMNTIALHKAGYMGHPEVVKLLAADAKAPLVINAQGPNNGYTPLHDAIWHGNTQAAKVFLEAGVSTELVTYENDTPKQLALRLGYKDIVALFK